ncbi:MAG: SIMPL domain-containing protein [Chloroflexota bacterium]|nr:SIMPL domain-containing protein [Chloroflexota bacterium]
MRKHWQIVIGLIVTVALVGLVGCTSEGDSTSNESALASGETKVFCDSSGQSGIWVDGQGKVSVPTDIAVLSLGVEAQAATVSEARTQAAEAMEKMMTSLKESGIAEKEIQTHSFRISQVTRWDRETEEEKVTGYRVTNMVNAKVRELGEIGSIIDAITEAGGDLTRIRSIDFTVEDPTPYYTEAREKAFADAEAKAQQLADLAGVTLGKVTFVSESSGYYPTPIAVPMPKIAGGASMEMTTSISPGEQEISLGVQVAYTIE